MVIIFNPEKIVAGEISACQNQVEGNNIDAKTRKRVHNAVNNVKIRMYDAFLTAMGSVVTPRGELAMRSITGSSGHGSNSALQNQKRRDFIGNSPLKSAFSRLHLNTDPDKINKARDFKFSEDNTSWH